MCQSDDANSAAQSKPDAACDATQPACPPTAPKKFECTVQFRPKDDWNGEYGIDWMRIGGVAEKAGEDVYKTVIASGHPGLSATDAYTTLKSEYNPSVVTTAITSPPDSLPEYFVPYLSLFPQGTAGTPTPPFEAELKILVAVKENAPEKIELEFDAALFDISKKMLADTAVGDKRIASDGTIKITCKQPLTGDKEIKVWATLEGEKKLAGQILVVQNDTSVQKKAKIVFVNVKTNINGTARTGSISDTEKTNIRNVLHQALIQSEFEDGPLLDLSANDDFRIKTTAGPTPTTVYGKFIYKSTGPTDTNFDSGLYEDLKEHPTDTSAQYLFQETLKAFLNDSANPGNSKYQTGYITVFAFNEVPYDITTYGQVQNIGVHNVALFAPSGGRKTTTLVHEILHGLGLKHTHDSPGTDNKYIFKSGKTDNIMSYSNDRKSTWKRQWSIVRSSL